MLYNVLAWFLSKGFDTISQYFFLNSFIEKKKMSVSDK